MARMKAEKRKAMILRAALDVAEEHGSILDVTLERVSHACHIPTSEATVRYYYRTLSDLWDDMLATGPKWLKDEGEKAGIL